MLALAATIAVFASRVAASATANLSFMANTPIAHFNEEDVRLLREAALSLLLHEEVGASRAWHNPNSTASGKIKITKAFESTEGFRCEVLRIDNSAAGWNGRASYAVCEIHPGDWKLHPDAKPKPSEKKPESPIK
jgi:hypothetical protein